MPSCHELLPLPNVHQCLPVVNTISRHLWSNRLGEGTNIIDSTGVTDDFNSRFKAPRPWKEQMLVVLLVVAVLVQLAALVPQFLAMENTFFLQKGVRTAPSYCVFALDISIMLYHLKNWCTYVLFWYVILPCSSIYFEWYHARGRLLVALILLSA